MHEEAPAETTVETFCQVDIRVGRIVAAELSERARVH